MGQQQQRIPRKMGKKCRPIEIDKNEMNLSSKEKCCQLVGEDGDEGTKGILVKITVGKDGSMDCKGNNVNSNKNKGEDKSGILVRGLRRKRPHHQTYTTINNDTDNVDSNIGSVVICKKDDVSFEKISNVDPDTACISSPGIIISSPQSPPTTSTNNYDDDNGDNNTKQQSPKKSSSTKKKKKNSNNKIRQIDIAKNLINLTPGTRFQVLWKLHFHKKTKPIKKWWKATLLCEEKKTHKIRDYKNGKGVGFIKAQMYGIEYDAYPEAGYPNPTPDK